MSEFLHDNDNNDAKAMVIPLSFSKNSRARNIVCNDAKAMVIPLSFSKNSQARKFVCRNSLQNDNIFYSSIPDGIE